MASAAKRSRTKTAPEAITLGARAEVTVAEYTGADLVAVVELSDKPGNVLARVGETCERVPAASLVWLFEQGLVRPKGEE